ncbi:MAG: response regulator [Verrucomicrobiota bacterium]
MAASSTIAPAGSSTTTGSKRFLRILYADDLHELREVARISFSRDGHGIECVPDGLHALDRIQADPGFDLVITDHHMPQMNGLALVRALREIEYRGKIIVFSSELDPLVAAAYRELHVDRMLFKPVFPSVLRQTLADLFHFPSAKV